MLYCFTTRTPAVTDVFDSGRNVGALRPGHRVGFRSLAPGLADDIFRGHNIFLMPKLLKLGPNSKQVKCTLDPIILNINVKNKSSFFSIDIRVEATFL